jgi:flagellar protein FlaG
MHPISTNTSGELPAVAPAQATPERVAEHREVIQAVKAVNGSETLGPDDELTFAVDRETRRPVIKLVNRNTKEVIRQIPAEVVLHLAQDLKNLG